MQQQYSDSLYELLKRNNITSSSFINETYKCMLISIFETIASELEDRQLRTKIKKRLLISSNKAITTKNITYELTKCKLNDAESLQIYEYIYAFFTKNNIRKHYDDAVRARILFDQNACCNICGKEITNRDAELDHIVPWTYVGDELGIQNLQILCRECNRRKSKNSAYNLKMFLINEKRDE